MKNILALFFFLIIGFAFPQTCGLYKVKFVGKFDSNIPITNISLPNPRLLEGRKTNFEKDFELVAISNNEFSVFIITNSLGSVFKSSEELIYTYKKNNKSFSFKIFGDKSPETLLEGSFLKNINVDWKKIKITKVDDYFEINLGEIKID